MAICDVNEYRKCVKDFNNVFVSQLFDTLHALCNLLLVVPDNLKQVCTGEQLVSCNTRSCCDKCGHDHLFFVTAAEQLQLQDIVCGVVCGTEHDHLVRTHTERGRFCRLGWSGRSCCRSFR